MHELIIATTDNELQIVKQLFLEYQKELGKDLCFQDFNNELNSLPGVYSQTDGCVILLKDKKKMNMQDALLLKSMVMINVK